MGSKRTKKSKEIELFSEKHSIRKNNESEDSSESEVTDGEDENNGVIQTVITKAPKRKKKNEGLEEVPKKVKRTNDDETESKKVKVKKRKTKSDSVTSNENEENEDQISVNGVNEIQMEKTFQKNIKNHNPDKKNEITWPDQDIIELINRMDSNIPDRDILAYRSRVEKLNWDNVAFKMYSAEECKETWLKVQKRIRRFRLLREILNDAKDWVTAPKVNNNVPRPRKHPDMPRRPLSSYLLFYLKKKDQIISENPGLDRVL
jgi:upstream-binding transcription factor